LQKKKLIKEGIINILPKINNWNPNRKRKERTKKTTNKK